MGAFNRNDDLVRDRDGSEEARRLTVIHSALETAEMIEALEPTLQTEESRTLCTDLRSFAGQLSRLEQQQPSSSDQRQTAQHPPAEMQPAAPSGEFDRQTATHSVPLGSGGMGMLMNPLPSEDGEAGRVDEANNSTGEKH